MKIAEQLLAEHSKRNALHIAAYIGAHQNRLKELFAVFEKGDYVLTQRAAWVLSYVADTNAAVLQPHVSYLVQLIDKPFHVAIRRNVLRVLQDLPIPEEVMGILADRCFQYLHRVEETGAVKAFAMTVLYKICLAEPDLKHELILTLEDMIPLGSPAVRSRGTKVIKLLRKL